MATRGASSQRIQDEADNAEIIPVSLSSLPTEIKLEIAHCCWRNDAAFHSGYDRRWRPAGLLDPALIDAEMARYTAGRDDAEESEAEFTDSDDGAESSDEASTASDSESDAGDEDSSDPVAPFGFEQDTDWAQKSRSMLCLPRVNREWHVLTAQVKFKSFQMSKLYTKHIISFTQDFLPRHGHLFRTINFPASRSTSPHVSFETLLALVPFMPNLIGITLSHDIVPPPIANARSFAAVPGVTTLLQHLLSESEISRLLVKDASGIASLNTFVTNLETFGLAKIKRLELPFLSRDLPSTTQLMGTAQQATLATTVARFPSLEEIVVSFGTFQSNQLVKGVQLRAMHAFIEDATRTPKYEGELRTSVELFGDGQLISLDYEHLCSLSDSTWSLTISTLGANEGFDYFWAMRLSHLGLPLPTPFPRLQLLVLSDIETRTDDQINEDNEHWTIPADFKGPSNGGDPAVDVHQILPYLSPTGSYPDGTPHTPNDNLSLYLLLLSSFDSSPLHTISLTGARLSFLLASPAFLPFLSQHLSTLKQLIIVSGDNSPDGAAHRRLASFCDANDVRLAFEGTYCPRDPPIDEITARMEELLEATRREGEKVIASRDHEALERLFAGVVEAERKD